MNDLSLKHFEMNARSYRGLVSDEDTVIEFIVAFTEHALIQGNQHVYNDPYLLTQLVSGAHGACFMHPDDLKPTDLDGIVGKPALDALNNTPIHISVAILDAFYYHLNLLYDLRPSETHEFNGLAAKKSIERARYIVELLKIIPGSRLGIIGAIDDIVRASLDKGAILRVADFARAGTNIWGIPIEYDGNPIMQWADTALITGNTLKTNTLLDLLPLARKHAERIVIYSMTGANIAPWYINYGADIVTTETFPYYWYANTESKIQVYFAPQ